MTSGDEGVNYGVRVFVPVNYRYYGSQDVLILWWIVVGKMISVRFSR